MFSNLDPSIPSATGVAFRELLNRKNCILRGQVPWSIAELKVSSDDIQFLQNWLSSGAIVALRSASRPGSYSLDPLKGFSNSVVCGSLLHILFSEHVRRSGNEGNYWGCIRHLPWPEDIKYDWFGINGQPTSLHRSVLEQAAQAIRLRNAFDIEGTFQWFSTGYLQFGFTHKGFMARLPEWLASASFAPNAVVTLLNESNRQSQSFQFLWSSLQDYRRGNISEAVTRQRMTVSPWILSEWHDEILKVAKKRAYLGTGAHATDSSGTSQHFLAEPRLRFDNEGQPFFETAIVGLADFDLTAFAYQVNIDNQYFTSIIRQVDGSYTSTSSESIRIPWQTQTATTSLESAADASITASQSLTCWLADEPVQVFRQDGRRYLNPDAFGTRPSAPIWLLHPTSLTHSGALSIEEWTSPDGVWCFRKVDPHTHSEVTFDGSTIWSLDDACQKTDSDGAASSLVRAWCEPTTRGANHTILHVIAEEGAEIRWCRKGMEPVEVPARGGIINLPFTAEHLESGILLRFGLNYEGGNIRHRLRISIPFEGAVWHRNGKFHTKDLKVLNSRDSAFTRIRIIPPGLEKSDSLSDYSLLEGSRCIRSLCNDSFTPAHLSGLGAPLNVFHGPFNSERPALVAAHAVIDGGMIHQVKISSDEIKIIPVPGMALRSNLEFVIWAGNSGLPMGLLSLSVEEAMAGSEGHAVWKSSNPVEDQSIYAVAVFFEGSCVGWWWNLRAWTHALRQCHDHDTARIYAGIIRILRCPILFNDTIPWITRFLVSFPSAVLSEWLSPRCELAAPSGNIIHSEISPTEGWRRAVGEIVEDSKLVFDIQSANEILGRSHASFDANGPNSVLLSFVEELARCSPWLAVEFTKIWVTSVIVPIHGRAATLSKLREIIAHLMPEPERVEDFCSNVLHADENFVDTHLQDFSHRWPHLPPVRKHNLKLLFHHDVIRRKAAAERLRAFHLP
jgi:hypothetical protein